MTRDKLFNGERLLFMDQYGRTVVAATLQELVFKHKRDYGLSGRISKMYRDMPEGKTAWVGYVIGRAWYEAHEAVRVPS